MQSDFRSNSDTSSTSSLTSSPVSSPSIMAMSDFSNVATSITASSSTTSLVVSSEGILADSPPSSLDASSFEQALNDPQAFSTENLSFPQSQTPEVDPQILEALRSKDRIYVLKLGEIMEDLINEKKPRADLTSATSYQRLLLHRCSAYYKLQLEIDPVTKAVSAVLSLDSRIPTQRLADLVPLAPTPQPAFKIMQRTTNERRVKPQSHAGSVTGEDADSSDIEPSEAGSIGGRSSATGGSSKKRMTMEEREAAYQEARSRIFMGFDEKKDKDRDMSASSSSLSLASSSAGGSSFGDGEDSVQSVQSLATESDRSGPSFARKDSRRGNPSAKPSGSRPVRPSPQQFASNGSGSSRNSRASSPSFTYASLYEPPSSGSFEPLLPGNPYPPAPFPYSAPAQPNHPYVPPYPPYYYQFAQQQPQIPPSTNPSDPAMSGEMYRHPPPMMYNPYIWQNPNPPPIHSAPLQPQSSAPGPSAGPLHPFPPFIPPNSAYGYPMPGYYTPPGDQSMASLPRPDGHLYDERSMSVPLSAMGPPAPFSASNGPSHPGPPVNNPSVRNVPRNGASNGNSKPRSAPMARPAWSYGPGVGIGGAPLTGGPPTGETTGPRLHSMRRQSTASNGSSSGAFRSSNSDDVSSSASSSTSSSSRRTYTSTSSSQHPLPARPDWAVGLKPDPTLHATGHHHSPHPNNNSNPRISPISPPRPLNGNSHPNNSPRRSTHQNQPPVALHPTDFPPLTTITTPEKRPPAAAGAWTNPSRSILTTPPFSPANQGSALVYHPNSANNGLPADANSRSDDGFQRPPPKSAELYNPKSAKRNSQVEKNNAARLNEQVMALSLADGPPAPPTLQPALEPHVTAAAASASI